MIKDSRFQLMTYLQRSITELQSTSKRLHCLYSNLRTMKIRRINHRLRATADENLKKCNVMKERKISLSLSLMRLTVPELAIDRKVFGREIKTG